MWRLLQLLIVGAILTSNAYQHWTPNPYAAAVVAIFAAWLVTWLLVRAIWLGRVWKLRRESRLQ